VNRHRFGDRKGRASGVSDVVAMHSWSGIEIHLLAKAKISELQMTIPVEEDIIWFQISMDVAKSMNRSHSLDKLGDIKFRCSFRKDVLFHEKPHEISPGKILHDHVEVPFILKTLRR
jgi:hypothetical protein